MYPIDFIRHGALKYPASTAVEDDKNRLSYQELMQQGDALAFGLQQTIGRSRLKVAICCFNSMEHVIALMAVHAMGAVMIPLNPRYGKGELDALVNYAEPDVIICDEDCIELMDGLQAPVVIGEPSEASAVKSLSVASLIAESQGELPAWPEVSPEDPWAIKFTGGSSGVPKGVLQSFRMKSVLISNLIYSFDFNEDDVHLCSAPLGHAVGSLIDPILAKGGRNILVKHTDAALLLDCMEQEEVTTMFVPPTLVYNLIEQSKTRPSWNFSSVKHAITGGAPISPQKAREASELFEGGLEMMFGQSEMPLVISVMRGEDLNSEERYTSAGRITPFVRVGIKDLETGDFLHQGEQGEIVAQSDMMMSGYLNMPEKTAETIIDGWLHTGDVGTIDADGFLYIKDRIRDVIISGGFNVYPSDVEAALMAHPSIHEAAVVGLQDEKWGERVEAAVECLPGESITEPELIAFCKEKMGSIKSPKKIHFMNPLPKTSVGKVSRKDVKERLVAGG